LKRRESIFGVSAPKVKGKRELKNLECFINFEARGWRTSLVGFFGVQKCIFLSSLGVIGARGF
jgi:hypothetical protein